MPVPIPGRDTLNKVATWKRNETPLPYTKGMIPHIAPFIKPQGIPPTIRDMPNKGASAKKANTDVDASQTTQKPMEDLPIGSQTTPISTGLSTGKEESSENNDMENALNGNNLTAEVRRSLTPDLSSRNGISEKSERETADESSRQSKPALSEIVSTKNEIATPKEKTYNKILGPPPPDLVKPIPAPPVAAPMKPLGKLVLKCLQGIDLKAGQGVFGKADPYLKLKIGNQVKVTDPDSQGGKKPVSLPLVKHLVFESETNRMFTYC